MDKLQRLRAVLSTRLLVVLSILKLAIPSTRARVAMTNWLLVLGFLLYVASIAVSGVVVAPMLSQYLSSLFTIFGPQYGPFIFGAVVSFPIFLLFLYASFKLGYEADIPDVS